MEPKHTKSKDEETAVESLDSHDRIKELLDPISQPTSLEKSEDEPVFQCKGDELRLVKMTTWMIAITLILAMWMAVFYIPFLFSLPLSTLIMISCLILGCAVAMQLKKEKSWIKMYKDRIEWSSFLIEKQVVVENAAEAPFLIEVGMVFNRSTIKKLDGTVIGQLPAIYAGNFFKLVATAQKMSIPIAINIVRLFGLAEDGRVYVPIMFFDFKRILATMLPLVGIAIMLLLPQDTWMKPLVSGLIVLFFCLISVALQISFYSKRKGRTGLLYGTETVTRIKKDEVIWSLSAHDLRCLAVHADFFRIRVQAVTQYGRRHDLGVSGLDALKFALANNIPIVTEDKPAPESEANP